MDFSQIRRKALSNKSKNRKFYILCIIFLIAGIISLFLKSQFMIILSFILSFFFLILGIANGSMQKADLNKEIYNGYILPKLHESFEQLKVNHNEGINPRMIYDLGFIDTGDTIDTIGMMEGFYRGVSFVSSGVRCRATHEDKDGDKHTETTFEGRIYVIGASVLNGNGFVDILDRTMHYKKFFLQTRKVTLNHQVESYYDIFVDVAGQNLSNNVLDYLIEIKKLHPNCEFYFRFTHDRIYMLVENVDPIPYQIHGTLEDINEEKVDFIIKKDSSFITNTISLILDKVKGDRNED